MAVFAPALSYLWESAKQFGLDAEELFKEAGIDPELRLDLNARVSGKQYDRLIWAEKQKSGDPAFAFHIVQNLHPSYLGAVGYAWMTSASLRKAFECISRFSRMLSDDMVISLEQCDDLLRVEISPESDGFKDPDLRERLMLANAVRLCRMNCGESFRPARVQFKQAKTARPDAFYAYFRCELEFGKNASALLIPAEVADRPLPGFNPQLESLLEQQVIDYLARLDNRDIVGKTQSVIFELLPSGQVNLEAVALKLNTSARTLKRKLREKGTSFKELLTRTRRELGERYIRDNSLSLTEIAFLLGFSESSSFSRAYKTWTGQSPSEYRTSHGLSQV